MKKLYFIPIISLFAVIMTQNAQAIDYQKAENAWYSLQDKLKQAQKTDKKSPNDKSSGNSADEQNTVWDVILEAYIASASSGLQYTTTDYIPGPISYYAVGSVAVPLYEEYGFGLYYYDDYRLHVWYEGDYATLIVMTAYDW